MYYVCMLATQTVSDWRVEAGPTQKYVLMKKPQPEFGPWQLLGNHEKQKF